MPPTLNGTDDPSTILRKALSRWDDEGGAIGKVSADQKANVDRSSKLLMAAATHEELHYVSRSGWLRAAVLGAKDGIVSTASLIIGVASAGAGQTEVLLAGTAGLVAGAMSMAAGEYVSVSSQVDTEHADLERERKEIAAQPQEEMQELIDIYVARGLNPDLARQVAQELMENDALGAHARDEIGLTETTAAKPFQAALSSAASFSVGAAIPLVTFLAAPSGWIALATTVISLAALALLGAVSARTGGAPLLPAVVRVAFWGAAAMAATAAVGFLFGTAVT